MPWQDHSADHLPRLIQAVLTRARERDGYVTKTKLVKYLYLFDVEHYRQTGRTLTGFDWIFHLYGPWTKEFEDLYASLKYRGTIRVRTASGAEAEAEFVDTSEPMELVDVIASPTLELAIRHIVDEWADRRLGEMLDYVYFYTEPMVNAARGDRLRFDTISREMPPGVTPPVQPPDRPQLERIRARITARRKEIGPSPSGQFTPAPYDEAYFDAVRTMDQDQD